VESKRSLIDRVEVVLYSTAVELFIYAMILFSVALVGVEVASPETVASNAQFFAVAEGAFIVFFSVEYLVKFVVAKDKWLFFRRYFIDLLAILPFLRFFRLFRGLRILRLLRVVRLLRLGNMMARRLSTLESAGNMREVIIILVVFLSTVLAGSIGIMMFERSHPDGQFQTMGDGLWWTMVTITTVGYGDKYPQTPEGRVLGVAIMLIGLSFYGLVAGLGSTYIIDRLKKGSEWLVSTFSGHIVILGVNDKLDRVVTLLLEQELRVVIVTERSDDVAQYPEHLVAVLEGDFLSPHVLAKARVEHASGAVILADTHDRSSADADARSVLGALALERMHPKLGTVVEAVSDETAIHLQGAGADAIIRSGALTAEMLAFSTDHPGYSANLGVLLRFAHRNRIVMNEVPARLLGKPLQTVQRILATERKILLGAQRDGETTLDPELELAAGDELICIEII